ncbi:MAG: glycosyltransferase involved in cell wall biosynthesis [Flavobacterium sp.]|jgi:glycosyltransferase involved in cell wall biosynthesis
MNQDKKILIIGSVWPEPDSSAAGTRMLQLISLFREEGFLVTFASPAMDSDFMIDLTLVGVVKKSIALNCSSFDAFVKELNPSVVLFDRFMMEEQFGWRVSENCPDAIRLLDTEDLHCLRVARQNAFKEKRCFEEENILKEEVAKREIASILRCDLSLMISEYEIELLTNRFKLDSSLLFYLPFLVEPVTSIDLVKLPSFEERNNFIFIGNFLHEPNWNAVQYLKETIWPLIKMQIPQAVVNVYGAYPSQKVVQLNNVKEGFIIKGRAANAHDVVGQARVVLAPLRFGAGLKGKLLEAMQCGTPSVTTSIGAESMHGDLPWNGFIANDVEIFVTESVRLYHNKRLWLQAQENGIKIINRRYVRVLFENDFKRQIKWLQDNLQQHRTSNFMGSLLQHHTMKSTKYMSMWIEEKNKK